MDKPQSQTAVRKASEKAAAFSLALHQLADLGFGNADDAKHYNKLAKRAGVELEDALKGVLSVLQPEPELEPDKGAEAVSEQPRPPEVKPPVDELPPPVVELPAKEEIKGASVPKTPEIPATTPVANPGRFGGGQLLVNPYGSAARAAERAEPGSYEQRVFQHYASKPIAFWYGGWGGALDGLKAVVALGKKLNQVITVTVYNIPNRDASGGYSAGGASYESYDTWVEEAIAVVGSHPCIWIIEPDALADLNALSEDKQQQRVDLIKRTVKKLKRRKDSWVYIDAGNYSWQSPETMAERLVRAGIEDADGFSVNVSGFGWQDQTMAWGQKLSSLLAGKHFVVDTSRNGAGPWNNPNPSWDDWCNPPGRLLGLPPVIQPTDLCDAFLWIKPVGESDGNCKGGPNAGEWYPEYAIELAREAVPR